MVEKGELTGAGSKGEPNLPAPHQAHEPTMDRIANYLQFLGIILFPSGPIAVEREKSPLFTGRKLG